MSQLKHGLNNKFLELGGQKNGWPIWENGHHFADIIRCIFINEKFCILIKISLKFIPKDSIDNNPALV